MKTTLSGMAWPWRLNGPERRYGVVTLPYSEARWALVPQPYNALKGEGEQRPAADAHVRKLKREMEGGRFTPTPLAAGLRPSHREVLVITAEDGVQTFTLEVSSEGPLPLTDGGHRLAAVGAIVDEAEGGLARARTEEERAGWAARREEALALPFTVTLHLDGDPQRDFVNLQAGRGVDAAHLYSLRVQHEDLDGPAHALAVEVARLLHARSDSPFKNLIRFDSRGVMPLPVSTLCARGASDQATSLVGLARVGLAATPAMTAGQLADCVVAAHSALRDKAPVLLAPGKVLTPVGEGGARGAATMLVGLAVVLAHRAGGSPGGPERFLGELVEAAQLALDEPARGGLSGLSKRELMGELARAFYSDPDWEGRRHDGLPVALLEALSPSAFGARPLPRPNSRRRPAPDAPTPEEAAVAQAV